jgi:DNA invertase Pin-like site-specific DNA recombinase
MNAKRKDQGTATIYLRVSQDKTGEGLAAERQETACRELCERNGWTVREVFTDNDISATTGKRRPGFEALLLSNPERLVTWHTDRLVRLTKELERVIDLGVNVHAVTAGHLDLSNPAGRAVARTLTAWATYEGEQKSIRQKEKGKQSAAQGKSWWGKFTPFGFNADGTHHEVEAAALRKAYSDLLAGRPVSRLVEDLNAAGHRTNHGNAWRHVPLRTLLLNARNAGIRTYLGEEVGPANWAGIIDEQTYRAAVRLLTNPERHVSGDGKRVAVLSGFATCGKVTADGSVCGGRMTRAWRGGAKDSPKSYPVYECVRRCSTVQGEFADALVLRKVIERLSGTDAARWFSPTEDASESATDLQVKAEGLRMRLTELAGAYAAGLVTIGQVTSATETLRAELVSVEEQMGRSARSTVLAGLDVEYVYQEWDGLDIPRQAQIVRSVVKSIVILPQGKGARVPKASNVQITFHN